MKFVKDFEATGLDKIEQHISIVGRASRNDLKKILKIVNIHFILEGINRLQSTLLCELGDSYVQQSQRYVKMSDDGYLLYNIRDDDTKSKTDFLIAKCFDLYDKMSELKEESKNKKGRLTAEDYKYGIPIEDARYILPLATKTNMTIAMSGDKLLDLFDLFLNTPFYIQSFFKEIKSELEECIPANILNALYIVYEISEPSLVNIVYRDYFEALDKDNNVVLFDHFTEPDKKVGIGALTSTNASTPTSIIEKWGGQATSKAQEVEKRVLSYNHTGISEQHRTTFGFMCSLVTYHQIIRHRLPKNVREDIRRILYDDNRGYVIPPTIKNSIFAQEYCSLINEIKEFRTPLVIEEKINLLLNCEQIKFISSSNARIDVWMLSERTCMTAQWEIRDLSLKKLKMLLKQSNILYKKAAPSCVFGSCKEGKLTCGHPQKNLFIEEGVVTLKAELLDTKEIVDIDFSIEYLKIIEDIVNNDKKNKNIFIIGNNKLIKGFISYEPETNNMLFSFNNIKYLEKFKENTFKINDNCGFKEILLDID